MEDPLQRSRLLYGDAAMDRLADARVLLIGTGGVGSWCAEALVRTGAGAITIVDADAVDATNINRQLPATSLTVGQPKVQVLSKRLAEIRPDCRVTATQAFYTADNSDNFDIPSYDVVIDAIDSLDSKIALIRQCTATPGLKFFSSMGAARRKDPARVRNSEFWKVAGCPLARALRDRFKRSGLFPARKFQCVWSDEPVSGEPKGTSMAVTAAFGLRLAALAIDAITADN